VGWIFLRDTKRGENINQNLKTEKEIASSAQKEKKLVKLLT
jgi:hypothetical protein